MTLKGTVVRYGLLALEFLYNLPVVGKYIELLAILLTGLARGMSGGHVAGNLDQCARPQKLLKLYQYEGCPYCRKVRETLSTLDLDVIIYPTPRETFTVNNYMKESRYRPAAMQLGGKCQFPLLVDENSADHVVMYESDKIIEYLWKTYGDKAVMPWTYYLSTFQFSFTLLRYTLMLRGFGENGFIRIPSKKPEKMLELYQYEPSPFCKIIRERLDSLEIPYICRNIGHGSDKRIEFKEKYGEGLSPLRQKLGAICVPFLVDPNQNVEMFESADIKNFLIQQYQDGEFTCTETIADYFDAKKKQ